MKMEVYTREEIVKVVGIIEYIQDQLVILEEGELYDSLEEVICILVGDEE